MSQQEIIQSPNTSSSVSPPELTSHDSNDDNSEQVLRHETVIRSPTHSTHTTQPSMPCFLSNNSVVNPQNPFSKTSSSSVTAICNQTLSGSSGGREVSERSTVILAPARLVTSRESNSIISSGHSLGNVSDKSSKVLLRPSVLRVADSSTNNSQNAQKDGKVFAFVSLSKEDISRPATTLLQSDIIRCGADTTSPFNGEEAPPVSSTSDVALIDDNDSNSQSFVFGENLEDRAVFINKTPTDSENNTISDNYINNNCNKRQRIDDNSKVTTDEDIRVDANTGDSNSGDMNASTSAPTESDMNAIKTNPDGVLDLSTISDSPEKSDNKRKFEVITGEEDEQNVLTMYCRLYGWESDTSSWKERGRGSLRLNDVIKDDKLCSRIVMRTSGALRVILNAHIMSGMKFDLSNEQCLRFTNVDGIYLIKGTTKDIEQLNSAIDYRLREISKRLKSDSPQPQAIEDMSNDSCISNK